MPFIFIIPPVLALYVALRCRQFSYSLKVKVSLFILLLILSQCLMLGRYVMGILPYFSLIPIRISSFCFAFFIFFVLLFLLRDVFLFLLFVIRKSFHVEKEAKGLLSRSLTSDRFVPILSLLVLCLVSVGTYNAIKVPDIEEITITIPNLPEELKGLRIVQLTDTHVGSVSDGKWLEEVVKKTNALEPDLILTTGDLVDAPVETLQDDMKSIRELKAKYGVFHALGNHEYYSDIEGWIKYFEEIGTPFLINEHEVLEINGKKVGIVAVGDPAANRLHPPKYAPDHEKALENMEEVDLNILLDHQPKMAKENAKYGYDLQLSGHTHGGLFFLFFPLISSANGGYVSGLYDIETTEGEKMQMYLSKGTGLWGGVSFRLGVPSEITLITLQ